MSNHNNTKISRYFTYNEVFASPKATELGINNTTTNADDLARIKNTAKNLDEIRESVGEPIYVNSWFRSPKLNDALGGSSKTSQHMLGEAADIEANGKFNNRDLFEHILRTHEFDQLILEHPDFLGVPEWVHISFKYQALNRNQVLVAYRDSEGKTLYKPYKPSDHPYKKRVAKNWKKVALGGLFLVGIGLLIYKLS